MAEQMVSGRLAIDDQYADEDFSSYTDIEAAVKQLYRICTVSYSAPGWLPIGMSHLTSEDVWIYRVSPFAMPMINRYSAKLSFIFRFKNDALTCTV